MTDIDRRAFVEASALGLIGLLPREGAARSAREQTQSPEAQDVTRLPAATVMRRIHGVADAALDLRTEHQRVQEIASRHLCEGVLPARQTGRLIAVCRHIEREPSASVIAEAARRV
jgi:hypothetical protein